MKIIDMHVHSRFSDGTFTPERLAAAAKRRGLSLMALTDHDTTAGLPSFMRACADCGVRGLTGIELSAEAPFTLHILGYRIRLKDAVLESRLEDVRRARDARNDKICAKLNALGFDMTMDEVREASNGQVVARPHFARVMVRKGFVANETQAFIRYLDRRGAAYVARERLSAEECISLIRGAGGVASLAHPAQCRLPDDELEALIARLKEAGLWGLEALYGANSPEYTYHSMELAGKFGLYPTAGTDFHGDSSHIPDLGMTVCDELLPWARLNVK